MRANVCLKPDDFFTELVGDAFRQRKVPENPLANQYLTQLLKHYMVTDNLFDETSDSGKKTRSTLAELYLRAMNAEQSIRLDLLKKLGDTSLYISGFFSESLNRKIIDLNYYVNMGETAFQSLSSQVSDEIYSNLYKDFSNRFVKYMDVLTYIAQQTNIHKDSNLLKLYENYQKTGSDLAKETLIDKGILDLNPIKKPVSQ